ncbi:MAG TPA: D-alanyl-D-alanine carboxypeptidase family protein [Reyranella sp.]|nr:D-alanyl-D-alanine carboxypeptidase family protein [Reyranella sp.]
MTTMVVSAAYAQQSEPPRKAQGAPKPRPAAKPGQPPKQSAAAALAAKLDAAGPSQIGTSTVARWACMIDAQTGTVLLAKDAEKPMAPSSMAKMMTVYLVFEDLAAGKLKMDTQFKVSERAYAITRGTHSSTMFLEMTSTPTIQELLQGIIVVSGNDASVAVAEGMAGSEEKFAERMNAKAHELGMTGSVFKNSSGWPAEGQMVTARDLAVLAMRTIRDFPQYYHFYSEREFTYNGKTQPNRNLELKSVAGVDGLKTGHTEEGGFGQTTSAIRDGRRLILVLNGMSSIAERAQETARLIDWGFRESSNTTVLKAGDTVAEAPVWLGMQDKVPLIIPHPLVVTTMVGQPVVMPKVVARFDGPIPAPIVKGQPVGTALITMPDGRTMEYPLQAGADVPRAGLISRMSTLVRHYLLGWTS